MAHVLHTDGDHHDRSGRDCSDSTGHTGDCSGDDSGCRKRKRRRHHCRKKLIDVGTIHIDCSPATYRTPGQARNVVSCAVSQTFNVPVTRTVFLQQPTDFGCFICTPVTQTVEVPVTATVNVPPVLVPVPRIVCPENVACPDICPAPIHVNSCGCGCQ